MQNFANTSFNIQDLPNIQQLEFTGLDAKYLTVDLITRIILAVVVLTGVLVAKFMFEVMYIDYVLGSVLLVLTNVFLFGYFSFSKKAFALRDKDVSYRSGLIFHAITTVPLNRIQHTEVVQGPILRLFSLASVNIYTAGGSSSDIVIPGLAYENAQKVREYINTKVSADVAE